MRLKKEVIVIISILLFVLLSSIALAEFINIDPPGWQIEKKYADNCNQQAIAVDYNDNAHYVCILNNNSIYTLYYFVVSSYNKFVVNLTALRGPTTTVLSNPNIALDINDSAHIIVERQTGDYKWLSYINLHLNSNNDVIIDENKGVIHPGEKFVGWSYDLHNPSITIDYDDNLPLIAVDVQVQFPEQWVIEENYYNALGIWSQYVDVTLLGYSFSTPYYKDSIYIAKKNLNSTNVWDRWEWSEIDSTTWSANDDIWNELEYSYNEILKFKGVYSF